MSYYWQSLTPFRGYLTINGYDDDDDDDDVVMFVPVTILAL